MQEQTDSHFIIKIDGLCKYEFCQAGDEISIVLDLANSNSIVFDEAKKAIELAIFTNDGYPVQKLDKTVTISPSLEGSKMKDFEIERKYNRIGGKDVLKFYVPPLAETVYEQTHLILDLPHEVAYEFEQEPGKF